MWSMVFARVPSLVPGLRGAVVSLALAAGSAVPALAQEGPDLSFGAPAEAGLDARLSSQGRDRTLIFSVLAGVETRPEYFGADDNEVIPRVSPNLLSLSFGALQIRDEADALDDDPNDRPNGFGIGTSFRFITERSSDDNDELDGLDDVDLAIEAGALFGYTWDNAEAFGALRYGVIGHNSWVGEVGANWVTRPADDVVLRIGPRVLYGSEEYNETYFGVTPDEAADSDFEAFDPDAGLVSAGVEMIATYRLGERWWLEGRAKWEQFQGEAADSPIVEDGSDEAATFSLGVRRAFVLEF